MLSLFRPFAFSPRPQSVIAAAATVALLVPAALHAAGKGPEPDVFFESKVRPLLLQKCGVCHGPKLQQGKLRVDSREALLKGGAQGPALVPGDPEASPLIQALSHQNPALKMPPDRKLATHEIAILTAWVKQGAPWPGLKSQVEKSKGQKVGTFRPSDLPTSRPAQHWSFRPVQHPTVPRVKTAGWVRTPIDAFVLQKLEAAGLKPAPPADRRTLIRRATFDLTGLPPTPEELDAFLADKSPNAWEKVVDRLLASPRYGERWGRYWLDCVRYADTNGLDENYHYANAWRYRDYVIDAFNRDLPYDQFVREQLAGDLLPSSGNTQEDYRRLTGTGIFLVGPKLLANPDKTQVLLDIIDEQADVTSRVFMGVTLSCARCHDHKFDPFTQKDYTAFAGILKSTRTMLNLKERKWSERPLAPAAQAERAEAHQKALDEAKKALQQAFQKNVAAEKRAPLEARVAELEKNAPPPVPYAMAVSDGEPEDLPLYIRGDHNQPSTPVKRGFPAILASKTERPLRGSGRLDLAEWMTRPEHPLTARVFVNRVWQGHFGRGLVATSDNFGTLGELPSHPELLDYLASTFTGSPTESKPSTVTSTWRGERGGGRVGTPVTAATSGPKGSATPTPPHPHTPTQGLGWSTKALHRLILTSSTYLQSSRPDAAALERDPDNRLLWRMSRRRLQAEEMRDAMLSASGQLDLQMGGSLLDVPNFVRVTTDDSSDLAQTVYDNRRRSVYLPVVRNSLFELLEQFDFVDPSAVTTRRSETVVATQSLFLMNHPLMLKWSGDLARSLEGTSDQDAERIRHAYRRVLGREPHPRETERAMSYLRAYTADVERSGTPAAEARRKAWQSYCQTLFCSNEFLYLD